MTAQVLMIDISANNHPDDKPIDWAKVKAGGTDAVMIKATEGVGYINPWLGRDAQAAYAANLAVGYYHFARPASSRALMQAAAALEAIHGLPRTLGLALDLEVTDGMSWDALATWALAFHTNARKVVTHSPLYVNDNFLNNMPGAPWGERLWLAQTARPRREVWAWQTTTPIEIAGIVGPVDRDIVHPGV